jgi:hypothetical protein
MMYRIGLDVHPPLYYITLRFWHYLFGDGIKSETSLEGGVVYRNGNFTLDSSLTVPLGGSDAFLGISGQIKF